jgi:hypothetical protein
MRNQESLSSPTSSLDRESSSPPGPFRLGVMGTMVWDRIVDRDARTVPVEEWGGISYALEALSVSLPEPWIVRPLVKVGEDMAERALGYLGTIPRTEAQPGPLIVPFPNPRVELRYHERERRTERLEGGVPPWSWDELQPLLDGTDALYLNFITGFEMGLETAQRLRESFPGPIYADLHSLFLGISSLGLRFPRELPGWGAWFRAFDAVQMNEDEFALLGHAWGDPWRMAADIVGPELKLIAVTLGGRGAAYVAAPDFSPDPAAWPDTRRTLGVTGASRSGRVPSPGEPSEGDPTGCGDVWGATFFGRLLSGDTLEVAMAWANRSAAKNVEYRGARGLHRHLLGLLGH